jgi:hypothetical protein
MQSLGADLLFRPTGEGNVRKNSYQQLVERLTECEDLAKTANDPSVRAKAAELAHGYRDLIARADQLLVMGTATGDTSAKQPVHR